RARNDPVSAYAVSFISVNLQSAICNLQSAICNLKSAMKIGLISLGCPKNLVDSEVMLALARDAGHELTQDAAQADVLVVNTCAFIDKAKQESIDAILEMARHKQTGACQRLVVTGC